MNIKQALYLKTIAEEGSITMASRKLYISQPSLSQTLKQVEEDLGVVIFDRSVTPNQITYAGRIVLEAADALIASQNLLEEKLKRLKDGEAGHIRLGISVQRSMQIIPFILPEFLKKYSYVTVELTEEGSGLLEEMLMNDRLDIALAATEPVSPLLKYELIEQETIGILAGKNTELAKRHASGPVTVMDVKNEKFVSLKQGHSVRIIQDRMFHNYGISPEIVIETDSFEVARRSVLEAGLCMFMSDIFVDNYAEEKGRFFPLQDYENKRHFYACMKREMPVPAYLRDLIGFARDYLKKDNEKTGLQ